MRNLFARLFWKAIFQLQRAVQMDVGMGGTLSASGSHGSPLLGLLQSVTGTATAISDVPDSVIGLVQALASTSVNTSALVGAIVLELGMAGSADGISDFLANLRIVKEKRALVATSYTYIPAMEALLTSVDPLEGNLVVLEALAASSTALEALKGDYLYGIDVEDEDVG